jgi:hypothetical protein
LLEDGTGLALAGTNIVGSSVEGCDEVDTGFDIGTIDGDPDT